VRFYAEERRRPPTCSQPLRVWDIAANTVTGFVRRRGSRAPSACTAPAMRAESRLDPRRSRSHCLEELRRGDQVLDALSARAPDEQSEITEADLAIALQRCIAPRHA